jgi:hypothetical protein
MMRHSRLWVSRREMVEATLFEAELFGPPRRRRIAASGLGEDYGRDYFPAPRRPAGALKGAAFASKWMSNTAPADWAAREDAIVAEVASGNVPSFLWRWKEVVARESNPRVVFLVTPDVMAVGADDDFVRMPMDAISAQRVADRLDCLLPTARMVNLIFEKADVRLVAITKQYNWLESSRTDSGDDRKIKGSATAGYLVHSRLIDDQLRGHAPGELVAGHKKEVIIAPDLPQHLDKLFFCGFHSPTNRTAGNPNGFFQLGAGPSIHPSNFADYAQGIRLVNPYLTIDGETQMVAEVLKHPQRSLHISSAPIARPKYRTTR